MKQLENIVFFRLYNIRHKKFANGLRNAYQKQIENAETIQQKQQRIKQRAERINQKLKEAS